MIINKFFTFVRVTSCSIFLKGVAWGGHEVILAEDKKGGLLLAYLLYFVKRE